MINHARTLLLNLPAAVAGSLTVPGTEYVPAGFAPVAIPASLLPIRHALFGSDPDAYYANYRCWQYMTLLHATELAEFVLALDRRITYQPDRPDPALLRSAFVPAVSQAFGVLRPLTLIGSIGADESRGRIFYRFAVEIFGTSVTVSQTNPDSLIVTSTPAPQTGATGPVQLGASGLAAYLAPGTDAGWAVTAAAKPTRSPDQIFEMVRQILSSAERRKALFGGSVPTVCERLYSGHFSLPYRLGAVVLAMIYQTESVRLGGA